MVSVIVPVYKSEKTLRRCVESLLAQTYQDFEILLIVDFPPDPSGVLCDRLASLDQRIRVLHQVNQGVSASRNYGIRQARGEFIRFVDSDDYVLPDSLSVLMDGMKETQADLVIAGYHHHYYGREILKLPRQKTKDQTEDQGKGQTEDQGKGQTKDQGKGQTKDQEKVQVKGQAKDQAEGQGKGRANEAGKAKRYEVAGEAAYLYALYQEGFLNMPWNKLYKREMIVELFRRELNLGEDLLFNLAYLAGVSSFAVVPSPVCEYIQDDRGTTLSTRRRDDKLELTMRLYGEVKKAFGRIYPKQKVSRVVTDKLVTELLDDVEGLAFESGMRAADKKQVIRAYEKQLVMILQSEKRKIHLKLLDYKIIFYFMKKRQTNMVYLMVILRGILVRLLFKR